MADGARCLADRIVVLAGAGSGGEVLSNGRATALALARAGAHLVLLDNSQESLDACVQLVPDGTKVLALRTDVTNDSEVEAAIRRALETFGRIDALHFNVGIAKFATIPKTTTEDFDLVFRVNTLSAFLVTKHVLPTMERQRRGVATFVSSISSVRHLGISSPLYDMSKASLSALSRHVAVQYGPQGIRANVLLLGMLDTPLARNAIARSGKDRSTIYEGYVSRIPLRALGTAEDVAELAVFIASDRARYISGAEIALDGGLTQSVG